MTPSAICSTFSMNLFKVALPDNVQGVTAQNKRK
jgi:hypothetical protein